MIKLNLQPTLAGLSWTILSLAAPVPVCYLVADFRHFICCASSAVGTVIHLLRMLGAIASHSLNCTRQLLMQVCLELLCSLRYDMNLVSPVRFLTAHILVLHLHQLNDAGQSFTLVGLAVLAHPRPSRKTLINNLHKILVSNE